jgi:hypothetical protein
MPLTISDELFEEIQEALNIATAVTLVHAKEVHDKVIKANIHLDEAWEEMEHEDVD